MSEVTNAIKQICEEKNLSYEAVIETIESALAAAYRKDFGEKTQNIKVEFADEVENSKVFDVKEVVTDITEDEQKKIDKAEEDRRKRIEEGTPLTEEDIAAQEEVRRFNPKTEIQLSDAKLIEKEIEVGGELKVQLEIPSAYGRMAAQTAKQVIIQRLREAERETVYNDFKDKEHEVITGVVQRREGRLVLVDIGTSTGVLLPDGQIYGEKYDIGDRIKVFVKEVSMKSRGAEIVLSRTSDEILKKIFDLEIPEITNGLIELKNVAREAGSRSKVAVYTESESIDPIGSCVGQRGARIQVIIAELGGEKVDIVEYSENIQEYITNALSPAKIITIEINEEEKKATVFVTADQLSLAIGKGGQNARLAARLTGWKIDIVEHKNGEESESEEVETEVTEESKEEAKETTSGISEQKEEQKEKDEEKEGKKEEKK